MESNSDHAVEPMTAIADLMDPLARQGPLRNEVRRAVVDLIVHYKLRPGDHLRESDIARQLGVSRVPVREALLALANEGWVDHRQARGAFVHVPTPKEVMDTFVVRALLEAEAASMAARGITAAGVAELRAICVRGRAAVASEDDALIVQANARFHRRIVDFADNLELSTILASIAERVNWYFAPVARTRGIASWDEHGQIVDALEAGDSAGAAMIMRVHTERTSGVYFEKHEDEADAGSIDARGATSPIGSSHADA